MRILRLAFVVALFAGGALGATAAAAPGVVVVDVPVHGTIDASLAASTAQSIASAARDGARAVVLDIDSTGGPDDAVARLGAAVTAAKVPVYAYVSGAAVGGAGTIARDSKAVAALPDATLDAAGFSNLAVVPSRNGALERWHLADAAIRLAPPTPRQQVASLAINPLIVGVLLGIGVLGLLVEMQTLSGVAGTIGALALAAFFAAHLYAGLSDWLAVGLAIGGICAVLFEFHVLPGHGIAGALGIGALVAGVILSFGGEFIGLALQSLAVAIVLAALGFWLATRLFPRNAFMARLAFTGVQGPHYVTSSDFTHLLGATGEAASYLRPSGVATIDGERVDVLTESEFVPAGTRIRVTRVEGARVFVVPEERAS